MPERVPTAKQFDIRHCLFLSPERVQVLLSWKHSGFNVHSGDSVPPEHQAELENSVQFQSLWFTAEAGRAQRYSAPAISVSFPSLRCHRHQRAVIEKILRHLGQWNGTPPLAPAREPPDSDAGPRTREPCDDVDPMPDYENVLTD